MSRHFKGAAARDKVARSSVQGPHWAAHYSPSRLGGLKVGDSVRIKRTGATSVIVEQKSYGFVLQGFKGFFVADDLTKI